MRRIGYLGALAALAVLAAGCSGSSGSASESPAAPTSTPASTPDTSAPGSTAPKTSAPPLSEHENDPGVRALRAFAAQAARTLTSGHATDAKLDALMTTAFARMLPGIVHTEVGRIYPGPNPFTPVSVARVTSDQRRIDVCWVAAGWSLNPKTRKVAEAYRVLPVAVGTTRSRGRWLVSAFQQAKFSCSGVKIVKQRW